MRNIIPKLILIFSILLIAGCTKPEVNYSELFTPPSVKIIKNQLILKGGSSRIASGSYVVPHAKIKKNKIYVYGTLSFINAIERTIKLPEDINNWQIYWVNKDGSIIEIKLKHNKAM